MGRFPCFYCQHLDLITENIFHRSLLLKVLAVPGAGANIGSSNGNKAAVLREGKPSFHKAKEYFCIDTTFYAKLASSLRQGFLFIPRFVDFTTCKEYVSLLYIQKK